MKLAANSIWKVRVCDLNQSVRFSGNKLVLHRERFLWVRDSGNLRAIVVSAKWQLPVPRRRWIKVSVRCLRCQHSDCACERDILSTCRRHNVSGVHLSEVACLPKQFHGQIPHQGTDAEAHQQAFVFEFHEVADATAHGYAVAFEFHQGTESSAHQFHFIADLHCADSVRQTHPAAGLVPVQGPPQPQDYLCEKARQESVLPPHPGPKPRIPLPRRSQAQAVVPAVAGRCHSGQFRGFPPTITLAISQELLIGRIR